MSMCLEKTIVSRKGRVGGRVLREPMRVLPSGGHPDTIPSRNVSLHQAHDEVLRKKGFPWRA